ncbi:MAG: YbbR-like domain-containing protein [Candidatus Scalinduaceae bacterium]
MLKSILYGNLRAKGMVLIMAIALWFYAINKYTGEINEEIPLIINTPSNLTILDTSSDTVTVSLKGPRNIIGRISDMIKDNKIKARYDFPDIGDIHEDKFTKTIKLTRRNVNLPQEIRLDSIVPNEIEVTLGRLKSKYLKVRLQKKGVPALGYEIASEYFYPHEVLVTGPANILKETEVINTTPIDVTGIISEQNRTFPWTIDLEENISIMKDDKYVQVPISCGEKINVWFQISEQIGVKRYEKVKVNVLHPTNYVFKVKLKTEYVDLNLEGPKLILERLNSADIMAYIDVSSLSPPGPYKQPVIFTIPEGLEIEGNLPEIHVDIVEPIKEMENLNGT